MRTIGLLAGVGALCLCLACVSGTKPEAAIPECAFLDSEAFEGYSWAALEERRFTDVIDLVLPCARKGLPEAEFGLAFILASAIFPDDYLNRLERDPFFWAYRAALQGHELAAAMLSEAFTLGLFGQPKDQALADCWSEVSEKRRSPGECTHD